MVSLTGVHIHTYLCVSVTMAIRDLALGQGIEAGAFATSALCDRIAWAVMCCRPGGGEKQIISETMLGWGMGKSRGGSRGKVGGSAWAGRGGISTGTTTPL